jgi:excisionase family DNA binding protein
MEQPASLLDNLLTPAQAAALLGLAPGTLEVWRCTKEYPLNYYKIGGRVRYRREDIEAFVRARMVQCGPEATTPAPTPTKVRRRAHRKAVA